jgi:hypothetical protein
MKWIFLVMLAAIFQTGFAAAAEDIKKKPPTPVEAERLASQVVMNDRSLHRGDIVSTVRGFFLYRGRGPDGYTNDFVRVPNPISPRFP